MNTEDIKKYLSARGIEVDCRNDRENNIPARLIRCDYNGIPLLAIGGEKLEKLRLNAVLDAIHWHLINFATKGIIRVVLGSGKNTQEVLDAISILSESYRGKLKIEMEVDFKPQNLTTPDLSSIKNKNWLSFFQQRNPTTPPDIAIKLSKLVDIESFRWYRCLVKREWSGRVEGLEVCRVGADSGHGELNFGKSNIKKARKLFLEIAKGREGKFNVSRINEVASVIKEVAISREKGELRNVYEEYHLESRILRRAVQVKVDFPLEPVINDYPFQFPTLWSPNGSTRFLDVLMRHKDVPFAVELKVPSQGCGEKYRHAISQAVLYREFIRHATQIHPWFDKNGMNASKCEGVVAFPRMKARQKKVLARHRAIGELFGVKLVEIDE